MKKITAIILFFCCNSILIFFEVHKQGKYLQINYEIQKLQTQLHELLKQKSNLTYTLYSLQQPDALEKTATEKLNMQKSKLTEIKALEAS